MPRIVLFLLSGIIFGAGLALSQMIDPARVVGFLDLGGRWNPALVATMAGAVCTTALFYWLARRRAAPLLGGDCLAPMPTRIDTKLVAGAAIFGAGWGLAGICPAPAIAVSVLNPAALLFLGGFAAAMVIMRRLNRR
ncbi:conserved membrane hypothetical protein [Candidatus Terasakiella magnetica]|nr:conserved membrane hypothetical protein [Candidatus Terasakiella magnetica]